MRKELGEKVITKAKIRYGKMKRDECNVDWDSDDGGDDEMVSLDGSGDEGLDIIHIGRFRI